MTWDPTATLTALKSELALTGAFVGGVQIGEPFSPPSDLTLALFVLTHDPSEVTLSGTIDVWTVMLRIYSRVGMSPPDAQRVEFALMGAYAALETALVGGFTLDGQVRAIDWVGEQAGHRVGSKWGHLDISGTIYRVIDITLPLIVDDAAVFAP